MKKLTIRSMCVFTATALLCTIAALATIMTPIWAAAPPVDDWPVWMNITFNSLFPVLALSLTFFTLMAVGVVASRSGYIGGVSLALRRICSLTLSIVYFALLRSAFMINYILGYSAHSYHREDPGRTALIM